MEVAMEAARRAGALILEYYEGDYDVRDKNQSEGSKTLRDADYDGFLAMEIDYLHEDFRDNWSDSDEDNAVAASVKELRRIADIVG